MVILIIIIEYIYICNINNNKYTYSVIPPLVPRILGRRTLSLLDRTELEQVLFTRVLYTRYYTHGMHGVSMFVYH